MWSKTGWDWKTPWSTRDFGRSLTILIFKGVDFDPDFNYTEFGTIKNSAGSNNFVLSVKQWIEKTKAVGVVAKAGRYGGTYAHKDIAFHFGMWISPCFQLLMVIEYQRLKYEEQKQLGWWAKRELAKINYH